MMLTVDLSPEVVMRVPQAAAERQIDVETLAERAFLRELATHAQSVVRPTDYDRLTRILEDFRAGMSAQP